VRLKFDLPFSPVGNVEIDNLRSDEALRWKAEDCRFGRSGSGLWKAGTSKVVAPSCVG
jgi:hypothetical protein